MPFPALTFCMDATSVEIYDIIMLVVLIGAMLFGAVKGFAWQLASLASILVSYLVAFHFREPFSQSIQAEPPWNRFLAMLILYVGTSLVIWVAFRMVSGSIDRLRLKEFDRQIGALFGLAKGALYCILITLFAVTLLGNSVREKIVASESGRYIAKVLNKSESVIPPEIQEVVQPYLAKFDEKFNNGSSTVAAPASPWGNIGVSNSSTQPGSLWETATSVAAQAQSQVQAELQSRVQTEIQNRVDTFRQSTPPSAPWVSGQSTPWNTNQPPLQYPQQATGQSSPWSVQQR